MRMLDNKDLVVNEDSCSQPLHRIRWKRDCFILDPPTTAVYVFEREPSVRDHEDPYSGDWVIDKAFVGLELCLLPLPTVTRRKEVSFE